MGMHGHFRFILHGCYYLETLLRPNGCCGQLPCTNVQSARIGVGNQQTPTLFGNVLRASTKTTPRFRECRWHAPKRAMSACDIFFLPQAFLTSIFFRVASTK